MVYISVLSLVGLDILDGNLVLKGLCVFPCLAENLND